jgi:hypothetical protein
VDVLVGFSEVDGVRAAGFVEAWNADDDAAGFGVARSGSSRSEVLLPGLVEYVAIPLAVNLSSAALCALVAKLVRRMSPKLDASMVEVSETTMPDGARIVVVRAARVRS